VTDHRDDDVDPGREPFLALSARLQAPGSDAELHNADAFVAHLSTLITASEPAATSPRVLRSVRRTRAVVAGVAVALSLGIGTAAAVGYHAFVRKEPVPTVPHRSTSTTEQRSVGGESTVGERTTNVLAPSTPSARSDDDTSTTDEAIPSPESGNAPAEPAPDNGQDGSAGDTTP
jgi:hypothetical protein